MKIVKFYFSIANMCYFGEIESIGLCLVGIILFPFIKYTMYLYELFVWKGVQFLHS